MNSEETVHYIHGAKRFLHVCGCRNAVDKPDTQQVTADEVRLAGVVPGGQARIGEQFGIAGCCYNHVYDAFFDTAATASIGRAMRGTEQPNLLFPGVAQAADTGAPDRRQYWRERLVNYTPAHQITLVCGPNQRLHFEGCNEIGSATERRLRRVRFPNVVRVGVSQASRQRTHYKFPSGSCCYKVVARLYRSHATDRDILTHADDAETAADEFTAIIEDNSRVPAIQLEQAREPVRVQVAVQPSSTSPVHAPVQSSAQSSVAVPTATTRTEPQPDASPTPTGRANDQPEIDTAIIHTVPDAPTPQSSTEQVDVSAQVASPSDDVFASQDAVVESDEEPDSSSSTADFADDVVVVREPEPLRPPPPAQVDDGDQLGQGEFAPDLAPPPLPIEQEGGLSEQGSESGDSRLPPPIVRSGDEPNDRQLWSGDPSHHRSPNSSDSTQTDGEAGEDNDPIMAKRIAQRRPLRIPVRQTPPQPKADEVPAGADEDMPDAIQLW